MFSSGLVDAEGVDDGVHVPDKDARIPEVVVLLYIAQGGLQIGLLAERVHAEDALVAQRVGREVGLDISVARLRTCGFHSQRDDGVAVAGEVHTRFDDPSELLYVQHHMVAGRHHDVGFGVARLDAPRDVGYAGCRITTAGLAENMVCRHVGQLFRNSGSIVFVGHYPYVFCIYYACKTLYGELQQRLPHAHHVDELLGLFSRTHGPEAATYAASHDNQVIVDSCHNVSSKAFILQRYAFFLNYANFVTSFSS